MIFFLTVGDPGSKSERCLPPGGAARPALSRRGRPLGLTRPRSVEAGALERSGAGAVPECETKATAAVPVWISAGMYPSAGKTDFLSFIRSMASRT